jgi:Fe-S-cluster containining protein
MYKVKQFVPSKICLTCNGCCRFAEPETVWSPTLLDTEIEELTAQRSLSLDFTSSQKVRLKPLEKKEGFICVFLDCRDNKCKIYSQRPFECQLYPFLINRCQKKIYLAIDLHCPFARENLKSKKCKDYIIYLTKLLRTSEYASILKDNPQVIQEYPDVIDLRELNT